MKTSFNITILNPVGSANRVQYNTISYQLFWSMIQLISRNQRAVSPEAQPNLSHDCFLDLCTGNKNEHTYIHTNTGRLI